MANKKSASSTKKTGAKRAAEKTTTKVTTVTAVEAGRGKRLASSSLSPRVKQVNTFFGRPLTGATIAEFIGTFILATAILIVHNEPFYLFIGLIGVFMMVGAISGAHINPAVTIAAWATKRIDWLRAVCYVAAQLVAAMLALVVMNAFSDQAPAVSNEAAMLGQTAPQIFSAADLPTGKEWAVIFAEIMGASILGFAYASILRRGGVIAGRVVGAFTIGGAGFLALAFASTAAAYVNANAVLNPAVALTLKAIDPNNVWTVAVYVVASILGAVIGFALHDLINRTEVVRK